MYQWVAIRGESTQGIDKEPWFGMITKCDGAPDNLLMDVIWLERCDVRGKYYQLCVDHPFTQVGAETIIMYGLELALHLVRKTKQCVFRVKTPYGLIKKISNSAAATRRTKFDKLVKVKGNVKLTPPNMLAQGQNEKQYKYINIDLWAASAEMAKSIFNEANKLLLEDTSHD